MTRPLLVLPADPHRMGDALREILSGEGPAILPAPLSAGPETDSWTGPPPSRVSVEIALVIETSGSSGRPKRVALSTNALLASAAATESALGGPGQWVLALPAHYIAGAQVIVRSIVAGTAYVPVLGAHFDPRELVRGAELLEHPRRYTAVVPAQLARMVELAESDHDALRVLRRFDAILVGGQALPAPLAERADALGLNVRRTYGSSETAGGCVYDGIPLVGVQVREVEGEIQLGGPMLANGYLGDEELTADRFIDEHGERWYRTNDGGTFEDGVLRIYGRLDNVIISGGVKVSLDRVERAVHAVHGFEDAVVVAAPSERWGQEPVVVLAGEPTDEQRENLRESVTAELGRIPAPRRIVAVDSLPLLSSGKPDRRALTRHLEGPH